MEQPPNSTPPPIPPIPPTPPVDPLDPIDPLPIPPVNLATTKDERMWAMFCHLGALVGALVLSPLHLVSFMPVGNLIVPFVIWLVKKDQYPLVADQGKESLNFQITVSLAMLVCVPFLFILIGFPMMFLVAVAALIFTIIATVKANEGVAYRYPLTLRLIK